MTLKSDAKFEEKLLVPKRKLINFNSSCGKSKNLRFDVIPLSVAYKVSVKKVKKNYLS